MRRELYFNPDAKSWISNPSLSSEVINAFHQKLPDYSPTRLVSLDEVAEELGVQAVYLKDESSRLGLPSFKILGASWGTFRAIADETGLPLNSDIAVIRAATTAASKTLYAATDGNHGRAVARMGAILGIPVKIYVPAGMHSATIQLIESEGAKVNQLKGSYDEAVQMAFSESRKSGGILVQDTAFEGYEEIPKWIVEGYSTMMREIDQQLDGRNPDLVVVPVGVGSFAQAVVSHSKAPGNTRTVLTVEPDTAACLWKSLKKGEATAYNTYPTIMSGMDCGTVSSIAWPILSSGVNASSTVSDYESHLAAEYLAARGISAGPCGAAPLAALRRLSPSDKSALGLNSNSVVVLLCTEGEREYNIPLSVLPNDATSLTQALVQIDSANPDCGAIPGPGETSVAKYIVSWLEHRDIETDWIEPTHGRPSIVGVVRGTGGGKSLMFNGHIDTVTLAGYEGDALSGKIEDGKLYGRGSADMKGGIAAALISLVNVKQSPLRGDVIFAGVADEEALSIGTEQLLQAGWRADAAIVNEPSNLDIVIAHKGFVWLEVDILGVASHGSRADLGVDAISKAGYFLVELDKYAEQLKANPTQDSMTGGPTIHASIINGGEEASSYPAKVTITLEMRTLAGHSVDWVKGQVEDLLKKVAKEISGFKYTLRATFSRPAFDIPKGHAFPSLVGKHVERAIGDEASFVGQPYWTDAALLADQGIPVVLFGPKGEGLHAKVEWVDVDSVETVSRTLTAVVNDFCK